jgi:hypothetical protein
LDIDEKIVHSRGFLALTLFRSVKISCFFQLILEGGGAKSLSITGIPVLFTPSLAGNHAWTCYPEVKEKGSQRKSYSLLWTMLKHFILHYAWKGFTPSFSFFSFFGGYFFLQEGNFRCYFVPTL